MQRSPVLCNGQQNYSKRMLFVVDIIVRSVVAVNSGARASEKSPSGADTLLRGGEAGEVASGDADSDSILYEAKVLLFEEIPLGAASWKPVTDDKCILRVIYDDDIFAQVILLIDEPSGNTLAETVIAVQTSLREDGSYFLKELMHVIRRCTTY